MRFLKDVVEIPTIGLHMRYRLFRDVRNLRSDFGRDEAYFISPCPSSEQIWSSTLHKVEKDQLSVIIHRL